MALGECIEKKTSGLLRCKELDQLPGTLIENPSGHYEPSL
jgi:hypothetical protein